VLDRRFPAVPVALAAIRDEVRSVARECGLAEPQVANVALAVCEAATNAIVHAYRGREGTIHVTARKAGGELTIVVADDGPGVVPRTDSPGLGVGLPIIASVTRRVELVADGAGTAVHLVFPCPAEQAA